MHSDPRSPSPAAASSTGDGRLKDTPTNRALTPAVIPQHIFERSAQVPGVVYDDDRAVVVLGDARTSLRHLVDAGLKVDCIVTSPPYFGQRDYGSDDQIGLESHPGEYLEELMEVFGLCKTLLRDTGSLWVNIGDTYWSGKGAHGDTDPKQPARRFNRPQDKPGDGLWARPKQQLLIPHRLGVALQDSGWLVRNDNVWVKTNPGPDQQRDRSSSSHEFVWHLTANRYYYYDRGAVGHRTPEGKVLSPLDTWQLAPSQGGGNHRATFSQQLVRIPVLASTPPNGVVLDPFNGSGTTMVFARRHGFRSVGVDVNSDYCDTAAAAMRELFAAPQLEIG